MKPSCFDLFGCQHGLCVKAGDAVTLRWCLAGTQPGLAESYRSTCGFPWNQNSNPGARVLAIEPYRPHHARSLCNRVIERRRE